MKQAFTNSAAIVLALFGLITLFLSGSVIFDLFGVRAKEGNYVLFVVWANFLLAYFTMSNFERFFRKKDHKKA